MKVESPEQSWIRERNEWKEKHMDESQIVRKPRKPAQAEIPSLIMEDPTTELENKQISIPSGAGEIMFSPKMVKDLLMPNIDDMEAMRLMIMCKRAGFDLLSGEVAISSFLDKSTGKRNFQFIPRQQAFRRVAAEHPKYMGMTYQEYPEPEDKYVKYPVKGVCTIWRRDAPEPYREVVYYEEAIMVVGFKGVASKKGGYCDSQPREFLRGVCEARACRHVFPDKIGSFYSEGERVT